MTTAKKNARPVYSKRAIISELKRVFNDNEKQPFTRRQYIEMGTISKTTVENRFGTWTQALVAAGLYGKFKRAAKSR
jgi:hypothetical protein